MLRLQAPRRDHHRHPSIAEVSVQSGKVPVVTGKSFGEAILIVLDAGPFTMTRKFYAKPRRSLTVQKTDQGC